jgi:predicted transcriptional regulator
MNDVIDLIRVFYLVGQQQGSPQPANSVAAAFTALNIAGWRDYACSLNPDQLVSVELVRTIGDKAEATQKAAEKGLPPPPVILGAGTGPVQEGDPVPSSYSRLIAVDPEDSLYNVVRKFGRTGLHCMPVLDLEQNAIVSIITRRSILNMFLARLPDDRGFFDVPLCALGVGTFNPDDIIAIPQMVSVVSVLNVMWERGISAVPITDDEGRVVDLYQRKDVAFLANDTTFMVLDAPIGDVRKAQIAMVRPPPFQEDPPTPPPNAYAHTHTRAPRKPFHPPPPPLSTTSFFRAAWPHTAPADL